jgi:hypothetical protein
MPQPEEKENNLAEAEACSLLRLPDRAAVQVEFQRTNE